MVLFVDDKKCKTVGVLFNRWKNFRWDPKSSTLIIPLQWWQKSWKIAHEIFFKWNNEKSISLKSSSLFNIPERIFNLFPAREKIVKN